MSFSVSTLVRGAVLATAVLVLGMPGLVMAERADRDQPMNIEADALRYEDSTQRSIFTGGVVVTKGSLIMRGSRLEVEQDADGNQSGTMHAAAGSRAFFRQKRDGANEFIEGEAERIEYDGKTDIVRFVGRAEMRRLVGTVRQDEVMGSVIVYNNVTEVYTVDSPARAAGTPSAAPGGRVRAVLAPRNADANNEAAVPLRSSDQLQTPDAGQ